MTNPLDAQKTLYKMQNPFMIKTLSILGMEGTLLSTRKKVKIANISTKT